MPLATPRNGQAGKAGRPFDPQAGRPASAEDERADGVFRDRQMAAEARAPAPSSASPALPRAKERAAMRAVLHVCTTCRGLEPTEDDRRPGALLLEALSDTLPAAVEIRAVECLSACSQGCSVALTGPGKWSYVYGRLTPADATEIAQGAAAYAATADGIVPWRERPAIFRKQSVARVPPLTIPEE